MLRCDRGSENAKVAYIQPFLRRHGTDPQSGSKSFQYGRSVSNQVYIYIYIIYIYILYIYIY